MLFFAQISLFREWYTTVKSQNHPGSTGVNDYPDALIPFADPYDDAAKPVGAPFNLTVGRNQPGWLDIYVEPEAMPGDYQGLLVVLAGSDTLARLTVKLKVWNFTLPTTSHLQAFADLFRTYCAEIEKHFVEKNCPLQSTFVYTIDEPKANDFPTIQRYADAVHAGSKKLQFMLTYPVTDALKPYVDLWAIFAGHYYPPQVQREQKAGKRAWFYQAYAEPFIGLEVLDTYGLAFRR